MNEALAELLAALLEQTETDLFGLARGWARVLPVVLIVPAFGARLLPSAARGFMGLSLSLVLAPALAVPVAGPNLSGAWILLQDLARSLPVAFSAAALLWAASTAGALVNDLRGVNAAPTALLERDSPLLGAALGLFAALSFLKLGGPSRVLGALIHLPDATLRPWQSAARDLTDAISVAVGLGAPVLVAVALWDIAAALIARAAAPAYVQSTLAPLRQLVVLAALGASGEALFSLLAATP